MLMYHSNTLLKRLNGVAGAQFHGHKQTSGRSGGWGSRQKNLLENPTNCSGYSAVDPNKLCDGRIESCVESNAVGGNLLPEGMDR